MYRPQLSVLLEKSPVGSALWFAGLGKSLYPLLRSGDAVRVVRCDITALEVGDLALVQSASGRLLAHFVDSLRPLRTSSFLGREDRGDKEVLGKAIAVRRGGRVVELSRANRRVLSAAHAAAKMAWGQKGVRHFARWTRDTLTSRATAPLRRKYLGPLEVRCLDPGDLGPLLVFAGDNLELSAGFLERQLLSSWQERGRAAGAFDERGRQWAFAFLDEYTHEGMKLPGHWVRSVVVSPSARGLGLGGQVVSLLLREAQALAIPRIFVDMRADNARSRSLFEGLGFAQAAFELEASVNDMLSSRLGPGSWKVLEMELAAGGHS